MIVHKKINIFIVLTYMLLISGICEVKAESYWATYDLNYGNSWSNTIITSEERQFIRININTGPGGTVGTYGITNGSRLSNKVVTFVFYTDYIPVTDIYIKSGNNNSYACEIYGHFTEGITQMYNVLCPYVGEVTDGYTSIKFVTNHDTLNGSYAFGISKINYFTSTEESSNIIANNSENINNSINSSDSPSNDEINGNTSNWNSNNAQSGVINQLVLMPITLLNSFVNGINGTCSPYDFGELWGEHLIFPCINLSNILGSLWTIIDVILSGMFIFVFGKRCVKIFNDFTNLRSGQIDTLYGGGN